MHGHLNVKFADIIFNFTKKEGQVNFRNAKENMKEIFIDSGFCNTKAGCVHVWFVVRGHVNS